MDFETSKGTTPKPSQTIPAQPVNLDIGESAARATPERHTLMGVAWVIIQPLTTVLIFTLVFNRFVRLDTGSLPYPLFALSGLLLWLFFANAVTNSTHSLVSNANLITKVYFPRMFIPAASVAAGLVDLSVAFLLLIVLGFYYGLALTLNILVLPLFVAMMALLALGVGLFSAAVTVKYRDLRHALPKTGRP